MKFVKKYFVFILILFFAFVAFKPILNSGFFPIHDDAQVARVFEMTSALKDGMFPVRWSQDLGYGFGYPIFNFYDPLPYYVGGFIGFLGFDALFSTKLMVIFSIIFSGFSMYFLSKEFFGKKGALFSSLLYIFVPFHAIEVYVRGDFAENLAYAFIPLLFYGLYKIFKDYKWKHVIITAISYCGVILSHNLTAMMVSPFVLFFITYLLFIKKENRFKNFINFFMALFIGVLLSSFYFIPAIFEMKYTDILSQIGGGANFRDHFVCLNQLWSSSWGFGGSVKGCIDGVSFMIGKYHILLSLSIFILTLFLFPSKSHEKKIETIKEKFSIIIFLFLGFLISIFFMLEVSKPIWGLLKPMEFFQYPWRFLIMSSFFSSFLSGALFLFLEKFIKNKNINNLLTIFIFVYIIIVSYKFFVPQNTLNKTSADYTSSYALNWQSSKISDEYMPKNFKVPQNAYEIPDIFNLKTKELDVKILERRTQYIKLNLTVYKEADYILPLAFFPSWKAKIDGKQTDIIMNPRGSVISFPKGTHILEVYFTQTPIQKLGNTLSVIGVLVLFVGIIRIKQKI